jgi:hypothetical protein
MTASVLRGTFIDIDTAVIGFIGRVTLRTNVTGDGTG